MKHLTSRVNVFLGVYPWSQSSFINPKFAKSWGLTNRDCIEPLFKKNSLNYNDLIKILDTACVHAPYEAMTGVEVRDPTSDLRLIKCCRAFPDTQYYDSDQKRILIRRAMKHKLPDIVREKKTLGLQSADWYLRFQKEKLRFDALINSMYQKKIAYKYFNLDRLRDTLNKWPEQITKNNITSLKPIYGIRLLNSCYVYIYILWLLDIKKSK